MSKNDPVHPVINWRFDKGLTISAGSSWTSFTMAGSQQLRLRGAGQLGLLRQRLHNLASAAACDSNLFTDRVDKSVPLWLGMRDGAVLLRLSGRSKCYTVPLEPFLDLGRWLDVTGGCQPRSTTGASFNCRVLNQDSPMQSISIAANNDRFKSTTINAEKLANFFLEAAAGYQQSGDFAVYDGFITIAEQLALPLLTIQCRDIASSLLCSGEIQRTELVIAARRLLGLPPLGASRP